MYPASWIRVSDADREAVVANLTAAVAEGRLTLEEFSERSQLAYASRTWGELSHLVGDLPTPPAPPAPSVADARPADSKLPLAALIVGIASVPMASCAFLGGITGAVAIVLGIVALRKGSKEVPGQRSMALAGVLCGAFGVVLQGAMIAFFAVLE